MEQTHTDAADQIRGLYAGQQGTAVTVVAGGDEYSGVVAETSTSTLEDETTRYEIDVDLDGGETAQLTVLDDGYGAFRPTVDVGGDVVAVSSIAVDGGAVAAVDGGQFPRDDEIVADAAAADSPFFRLFSPASKAAIVDALLEAGGEPKTVSELCASNENLTQSQFNRQRGDLEAYGLIVECGKRGNATTYALDVEHPLAAALKMAENVMLAGKTPMLLDEECVVDSLVDRVDEAAAGEVASKDDVGSAFREGDGSGGHVDVE